MVAFCLILAGALPVGFWIGVLLYSRIYGVSIKVAFICVFKTWMEPL
jgi:hypothetical protein